MSGFKIEMQVEQKYSTKLLTILYFSEITNSQRSLLGQSGWASNTWAKKVFGHSEECAAVLWRDHLADCKWPTVRISLTLAGTALLGIAFDKYMPQIPNAKYTPICITCPKITTVRISSTLVGTAVQAWACV